MEFGLISQGSTVCLKQRVWQRAGPLVALRKVKRTQIQVMTDHSHDELLTSLAYVKGIDRRSLRRQAYNATALMEW